MEEKKEERKKKIVVTGDLLWDNSLVKYTKTPIHHSIPTSDVLYTKPGGAWYLKEMIELACPTDSIEIICFDAPKCYSVSPNDKNDRWISKDKVGGDAYQIWSPHAKIENKKDSGSVWRIGQDYFLGCNSNKGFSDSKCKSTEAEPPKTCDCSSCSDLPKPDILVLDDIGLSFRDSADQLNKYCIDKKNGSIILKTVSPICKGSLWEKLIKDYADILTVILPVYALRARGADISKALSWDRTIEETVLEFDKGFSAQDLARCRRVIVCFGTAGVASFSRPLVKSECCQSLEKKAKLERFLYHPDELEGSWESMHPGQTFGKATILTSAMVRHEVQKEAFPLYIALGRGLATIRSNHELGAGSTDEFDPNSAHKDIEKTFSQCLAFRVSQEFQTELDKENIPDKLRQKFADNKIVISQNAKVLAKKVCDIWQIEDNQQVYTIEKKGDKLDVCPQCKEEPASQYCTAFPHSLLDESFRPKRREFKSDLLQDLTGDDFEFVVAKATEVVLYGAEKALRTVPKVKYGKYLTVDRQEIERINAIRNLIITYQKNPQDHQPLSIAVFGAPGAGKSFAIKQLASELFGEKNPAFEFNLSQFRSDDELITAFHQIRDASVQSQIPLVFWDEFDTKNLEWLKNFLCPMQDAKFQSGSNIHPFGKAVFVFAGGTCTTFEAFDRTNKIGRKSDEFREKKGPDFISRLRGFVNIKGPNPVLDQSCSDKVDTHDMPSLSEQDIAHLIRRAILLRSSLSKSASHLIDSKGFASISAGVVRGFLRVKKFLHGARSLDAIVSMSSLPDAHQYGVSELPSPDLLNLHVTPDFMDHVHEGELEVPVIEALAKACQEAWMEQKKEQGYSRGEKRDDINKKHPLIKPYAELDEEGKERNRVTARLTSAKLLKVGCCIQRNIDCEPKKTGIAKFDDPCMKELMLIEHDIWLRNHLLDGYEYSDITNDALRLHRDAIPFVKMSSGPKLSDDQELDKAIIASIPEALRECGYMLVPIK